MQVHQFVDHIAPGDAITYHAFQLRKLFQANGLVTRLFVNHVPDEFQDDEGVCLYGEYDMQQGDSTIVFHHSIFSPSFSYVSHLPAKHKVMIFHNITSPEFFPAGDFFRLKHIEGGYRQLARANEVFDSAIADSSFNASVLREYGFTKPVTVIPPFVDLTEKFGVKRSHIQSNGPTKVISVSQFLYHKKQDDVIKLFKVYRSLYNQKAELFVIGGKHTDTEYGDYIKSLIGPDDGITITGKIPLKELIHHFRTADALVSMSEHEGFGVPLVEAMYFQVPILAYNTGAVAETLGSGGLLIETKEYLVMAALLDKLINNPALREQIKNNQKNELKRYDYKLLSEQLMACLIKN